MIDKKHIIVYAEDDLEDLQLVKECFEKHKEEIELLHAPDGKAALELLDGLVTAGTLPCLIILDINMPVMDGRQALVHIKKNTGLQNVPVVVFTTSNSKLDKDFAQKWGADFMTKPLKYAEIENLADEFTRRCSANLTKRG